MTWTPHPATLAYRVMVYLKTLPRGKFVATGPLAQKMEQPSSALITSLLKPVDHGLIIREKRNGFYHWSLTDRGYDMDLDGKQDAVQAPGPAPDPEPESEPGRLSDAVGDDTMWGGPALPPTQDLEPAKKAAPIAKKRAPKRSRAVDIDRVHSEPAEPVRVPAQEDPFGFSWSSENVLTVSKGGQSVSMGPEEYQKLSKFIDVIGRAKL